MSAESVARQPIGTPVGGQFAATTHAEPDVVLVETRSPARQAADALKPEWQESFDALRAAGMEHDADDPIAARYRAASDALNHALRKTDGEVATASRSTVTDVPVDRAAPRIMLTVQLQEWVGDTAYPVDDQFQVDVTDLVSRLTPEQVAALKDDDDTADDLFLRAIDEGLTEHHNGPFSVQVEASLLEHQIAINPVDGLTALATKLDVDPSDLDDAVRDVTDTMASTMVNGDPDAPAGATEPTYDPITHTWSHECPCIRAEQRDPECPWHGRHDSQDQHYGDMDVYASSVNNGGIPAQVAFLVEQVGAERTETILRESADSTARSAALVRTRKPGR